MTSPALSKTVVQSLVKNKLNSERVKLWLHPYSDEETGAKCIFTQELEARYSKELKLPLEEVQEAVEELRVSSLERQAARASFLLTGIAPLKVKIASSKCDRDRSSIVIETKLDVKGAELRRLVIEACKVDADRIKLISGGRIIVDDASLEEQKITVSSIIMAIILPNAVAITPTKDDSLETTRRDAEILSNQADVDSDSMMQIADQSGRSLNIPREEKRALALAMILNEKGKTALRRKDYSEALLFLLEADKEFKKCSADILSLVDNYALLCLDITWCYLCLKSIEDLPDAESRLKTCEDCLRKSYGPNLERLQAVKGATGSESAILVRLHLLQGIAAFHRRQLSWAQKLFNDVESELKSLKVDDGKLCEVMALGHSASEARLGLRNSGGDVELAISFLLTHKKDKEEQRKKEVKERKKKAMAQFLGKTANGEWVNVDFYNNLISMGYPASTASEALKQSNNSISLAVQIIQDNPDLLKLATSAQSITDEMIAQVASCGFDMVAARTSLSKHGGNVEAAIEELLASGGVLFDALAGALSSSSGESAAERGKRMQLENEALGRLRSDITDDDEAHLDLTLEEENTFLEEYKQLLKYAQA